MSYRLIDFNPLFDDDEDVDESEQNALLQYCFADLYGANYGFRTLLEYDEECTEGATCDSNGESIENGEGDHSFEDEIGELLFKGNRNILFREIGSSIQYNF